MTASLEACPEQSRMDDRFLRVFYCSQFMDKLVGLVE